jgi:hypothetical protein
MEDIHHWEHLPANERQLLDPNGVWLTVASGEIYFPSGNILTYLFFQIVRDGDMLTFPCLARTHGHPTDHLV